MTNEMHGPKIKAMAYYIGETGRAARQAPRRVGEHLPKMTVTGLRMTAVRDDVERRPNGALAGKRDKGARRILRAARKRQVQASERAVMRARAGRLEVEKLATNSHEAKRYVAANLAVVKAERAAVRAEVQRWVDWFAMWGDIGRQYAGLVNFARGK